MSAPVGPRLWIPDILSIVSLDILAVGAEDRSAAWIKVALRVSGCGRRGPHLEQVGFGPYGRVISSETGEPPRGTVRIVPDEGTRSGGASGRKRPLPDHSHRIDTA
jgi:hypothetical protein